MAVTYSPQVQAAMASRCSVAASPRGCQRPEMKSLLQCHDEWARHSPEAQLARHCSHAEHSCRRPRLQCPLFSHERARHSPEAQRRFCSTAEHSSQLVRCGTRTKVLARRTEALEYYRAFQQHDSDKSLPRWFCLACLAEVQQRGSMAPACPARLAHEATSPHQQAVAAGTALRLLSLPESLLLPPVVAPPMPRPGSSAQRTAAKPGRHTQIEALQQDVRASAVAASALCSAEDIVELDRYLLDRLDKGTAAQPAVPAGTHTQSQALRQDLRASAVAAAALPTDADMLIQYLLDRRGKGAPSTSSGEECSAMPHGRNAAPVLTHRCIDACLFAQLSYRIHLHHIRPALLLVSLCHECRGIPCRAGARRTRRRPRQLHLRRAGRSQALRVRMPPYAANALLGPCQHMYSITGVRQDLGL